MHQLCHNELWSNVFSVTNEETAASNSFVAVTSVDIADTAAAIAACSASVLTAAAAVACATHAPSPAAAVSAASTAAEAVAAEALAEARELDAAGSCSCSDIMPLPTKTRQCMTGGRSLTADWRCTKKALWPARSSVIDITRLGQRE